MFEFIRPVFANLLRKPATRQYPVSIREPFSGARGHISGIEADSCVFCGICAKKCPADAITIDRKARTWQLDTFKCIICSVCAESCPKGCITVSPVHRSPAHSKSVYTAAGAQPAEQPASEPVQKLPTGIDTEKCIYCTLCAKKCPVGAITVDRAAKIWTIDKSACAGCGECISKCPKKAIITE